MAEREKFNLPPEKVMEFARINDAVRQYIADAPIEAVGPLMIGFLANIFGPWEDDKFRSLQIHSEQPCGVKGCGCHIMGAELYQALEKMRDDWLKNTDLLRRGITPLGTFTQL